MKYLMLIFATFFISISAFPSPHPVKLTQLQIQLKKLEKEFDGKIGLYAIDTSNNQIITYRADESFPIQSTYKVMDVSVLLHHSNNDNELLNQKIHYTKNDLNFWHPITGAHVSDGMTFRELAEAAISYSDNTAANLITKKLGGPGFVTEFAHSIGNHSFSVSHYEGELNSNPKIQQDTSTPKDMAISLQKIVLGNVLTKFQQAQLINWMKNDTVGYKKIRAGVPIGWMVADKTGSGDYGIANDIGILWSPTCKPIVLAIYTIQNKQNVKNREDIVASITGLTLGEFEKQNKCFNALF